MPSARSRLQLRALAVIAPLAAASGAGLNLATTEFSLDAAAQGMIDAVLLTGVVGGYLLFVRDGLLRRWFQRWNFAVNLAMNATILVALFLVTRAFGQFATSGDFGRFLDSFTDDHLVYALSLFAVFAFSVTFVLQMNRMVGTNVLGYFLAGVYHRPREEDRIFLFLDLVGSTRLAEQLESARYYDLLRRFVDDLSEPILASRGEIYQYAGDEVVITWRWERGVRDAACIRCFFAIEDRIDAAAAAYRSDFGVVPHFRAGIHGGPVTGGELGDLKREIVFSGDVLNTAARLEEYAKQLGGVVLVASGTLLDALTLPAGVRAEHAGDLELRGKQERVAAYRISRA